MRIRNVQLIAWIGLLALTLPACGPPQLPAAAQVLLFNGTGTSPNDVKAFEAILKEMHLTYATVNSRQLNGMSVSQLTAYRLLIIPGGNYLTMGNNLTHGATTNVHDAIQGGLNYLGVCAGGLLAGSAPCNSLNLTSGVRFGFYAVVNQRIHKTSVLISAVNTPQHGTLLGGWPAIYWLGDDCRQVSRWHPGGRRGNVWQGMGDPLRLPSGSPKQLAARNVFHHTSEC